MEVQHGRFQPPVFKCPILISTFGSGLDRIFICSEGQQVREAPSAFQHNGSSSHKAMKTILQKYLSVLHSLDLNPISFRHELECKLPSKPCLPTYLSNPYVNKRVQPPGSWLLTLPRKVLSRIVGPLKQQFNKLQFLMCLFNL